LYLQPGEIVAFAEPYAVTTILGSCVALCLHDHQARVGGVNHYLLPLQLGRRDAPRYGSAAIPMLIDKLLALGARRDRLVAKVFGGACVMSGGDDERRTHLGAQNTEVAFRLLAEEGIPVAAEDVHGNRGRKVVFHTDDGSAWVKRL
jgi:chemotaxis protein CheD